MNVEMMNSLHIGQRFINIGRLNIGLEHEIRNKVGSLLNDVSTLKEIDRRKEKEKGLDKDKILMRIESVSEDLSSLSKLFLELISTQDRGIKGVRIIDCIENVIRAIEPLAKHYKIGFKFNGDKRLDNLTVSNGLSLEQILFNLFLNAIQHIEMENLKRWSGKIEGILSYEANQRLPIKIRVKDNGPGIHKKYFEKIFDLLFSTKLDGTGMGLYLCRDMIKSLGGRIDVEESVIFKGTTFLIELPER